MGYPCVTVNPKLDKLSAKRFLHNSPSETLDSPPSSFKYEWNVPVPMPGLNFSQIIACMWCKTFGYLFFLNKINPYECLLNAEALSTTFYNGSWLIKIRAESRAILTSKALGSIPKHRLLCVWAMVPIFLCLERLVFYEMRLNFQKLMSGDWWYVGLWRLWFTEKFPKLDRPHYDGSVGNAHLSTSLWPK